MNTHFHKGWILAVFSLLLAGCEPIVDARGHGVDPQDLKQVVLGQTTAEDVQALLGTPSARADYGDETWYYITEKKETYGLFPSEITEQHVTAITFDANHVVTAINDHEKEQGKEVVLVDKTTPTEGHHIGVLEQLLGNVGRFSAPGRTISPRDMGR